MIKRIGKISRKIYRNNLEKRKLNNTNFTILSNNCIGGVIYHDMGLKFLSPTINLYIVPNDFVKFLGNLDYYLKQEIVKTTSDLPYPVGKLDDIKIFFKHYRNIEEAKQKWNVRKQRINYNNLYVMMTDRWCLSYNNLKKFDNLPFKHKICFTARPYPEFSSCVYVKEKSSNGHVGIITDIISLTGKRLYQYAENFDYIKWLNQR